MRYSPPKLEFPRIILPTAIAHYPSKHATHANTNKTPFHKLARINSNTHSNATSGMGLPKCFWGSFVCMAQNPSENSKPFCRLRFGRGLVVHPLSNGEWLRDIQHSMSMALDARYYYKMWQLFYYKMRQYFSTQCDRSLLQNATVCLR